MALRADWDSVEKFEEPLDGFERVNDWDKMGSDARNFSLHRAAWLEKVVWGTWSLGLFGPSKKGLLGGPGID